MEIRPDSLFHRYPRHCCSLLGSRDCRLFRRRNATLHPRQGTRISFKDFYLPTVPSATISAKVASHSTSNSAGIATKRRGAGFASESQVSPSTTAEAFSEITDSGDLRNQRQEKGRHDVRKDSGSDDGLNSREKERDNFINLINMSCKRRDYYAGFYYFNRMMSAGHSPSAAICAKLINCFTFFTLTISKAQEAMEIIENHGSGDTYAYNCLLAAICNRAKPIREKHEMELCIAVLDRMQAHGCPPNLSTYHILINDLGGTGQFDLAMEVLCQLLQVNQGQHKPYTFTMSSEASIMDTHDDSKNAKSKGGGITRIIKLLEEMTVRGLQPNIYTIHYIVKRMCRDGLVDQAWQLIRTLRRSQTSGTSSGSSGFKPTIAPDRKSYHELLTKLCLMGRLEDAKKLLSEMVPYGRCRPNVVTYNIIIAECCQRGKVDWAIKFLDDMIARGLKPSTKSYQSITSYYCKHGKADLAIAFMEHALSCGYVPDINNYNIILSSLCKSGAAYPSLEVLDKLEKMGYRLNAASFNGFIAGFWFNGDRNKAVKMLSQMVDKGIHPNKETYDILISCLCWDGMPNHAIQLMADMEDTWGYKPTQITYNSIVQGLCTGHHIGAAIDIFMEMMERCKPSRRTYEMLVEGLAHAGHVDAATKVGTVLLSCNAISNDLFKSLKNLTLK